MTVHYEKQIEPKFDANILYYEYIVMGKFFILATRSSQIASRYYMYCVKTGFGIDFLRPLGPANLHHRFRNTAPKGRCISDKLEKIG